ncbi:MAG: YlbF family regulator [Clostridia bacterium]
MNIYDQAHALARSMKETPEYQAYTQLREVAYRDETNKALLDEYKRLQYRMQTMLASGRASDVDQGDMTRMQQIGSLLQFNSDASQFLMAELRFQKMLADVYKILGEVAGIDLDLLMQG